MNTADQLADDAAYRRGREDERNKQREDERYRDGRRDGAATTRAYIGTALWIAAAVLCLL